MGIGRPRGGRDLQPGSRAPYFSMVAAGSGRRVSLRSCAGRPLVLVFHGRENAGVVSRINRALRPHFEDPEAMTIASVIDLSFVPPLYWAAANLELDRAYRQTANELPVGADPGDYVTILPDWTGSTTRKFHAGNAGEEAVIVVVGGDVRVLGVHRGDGAEEAILGDIQG